MDVHERRWWPSAVLLLGLCGVGRLATLQGLIFPVRIGGASMCETLWGACVAQRCRHCGFPCRYDAENPPIDLVLCPNCASAISVHEPPAVRPGQRVLIDRMAYWFRPPQRWDVVAFGRPGREDRLEVKRIVGLPGERIAIRQGELYANGRLVRKSLRQLRDMAVLVHDDAYRPRGKAVGGGRWHAESNRTGWRCRNAVATFEPGPTAPGGFDWLVYHHRTFIPGPSLRAQPYAVLDDYGCNQQMSRQRQYVRDLMLVCWMHSDWRTGAVAFSAHDGRQRFDVVLCPERNDARLFCTHRLLETARLPPAAFAREFKVEFALCDRQVLFAIDGQCLIRRRYDPATGPERFTAQPIRVGARGMAVAVRHLQVYRDLYFLDPNRVGWDWSARRSLSDDEYFVVGDNIPLSEDSRHWAEPGLARDRLLGKVLSAR